jgi:hypothetical protein
MEERALVAIKPPNPGKSYMVVFPGSIPYIVVPAADAARYCQKWNTNIAGDVEVKEIQRQPAATEEE